MSTYHERRIEVLNRRLRSRTKADGSPMPGFKQNVASIRAELASLEEMITRQEDNRGE